MTAVPPGACDCCTSDLGELIFTGVGAPYPLTLSRQAWCTTDLTPLWEVPNQRGANVIIPGAAGQLPLPRRPDETDYVLPFIVSGVVDENGTVASDEQEQLRENLAYLATFVFNPPTPPLSTVPAQLKSPDGGLTLDADVQFGSPPLVPRYTESGLWVGSIHMVIPAGAFA